MQSTQSNVQILDLEVALHVLLEFMEQLPAEKLTLGLSIENCTILPSGRGVRLSANFSRMSTALLRTKNDEDEN